MSRCDRHVQLTFKCSNVTWNDYELHVWVCVSRAEIYPTFAKTLIQSTRKSMHAHTHARTQRCEREGELTGRLAGELPAISHTLNSVEFFNKITHLWCLMTPPPSPHQMPYVTIFPNIYIRIYPSSISFLTEHQTNISPHIS